jgi:ribosomal protein S12 methylthiotransferase
MIVGSPGEREEDMEELMGFVEEMRFERLGVFTYSDEEDSAAHQLDEKLPDDVKKDRQKRLMKLQAGISKEKNRAMIGKCLPVLVEGSSRESELLWEGRLSSQAPDIDGVVYLNDGITEKVSPGDIVPVQITEAHEYDLVGKVMGT